MNPSNHVVRQFVATHDLDEAHDEIARVYNEHDLKPHDNRRDLDFKLRSLSSDRLTIGHLRYGADAELLVPALQSAYHVNLTLRGQTMVQQADAQATTQAGVRGAAFTPFDEFSVRWSPEAVQYAIQIPRASLEGELAGLIGRPVTAPIEFKLGFDLTSARGRGLVAAVEHLSTELSREGGIAELPLIRAQLESYVLSQMLLVIPHDHQQRLLAPEDPIRRRHVRAAVEFIEEHVAEPITSADIARAACVSLRALQSGFQEEFGVSPIAYLRSLRLDRARTDLIASSGEVSVSEVAGRWGFYHLSRFAEHYRKKFGEAPSETARTVR